MEGDDLAAKLDFLVGPLNGLSAADKLSDHVPGLADSKTRRSKRLKITSSCCRKLLPCDSLRRSYLHLTFSSNSRLDEKCWPLGSALLEDGKCTRYASAEAHRSSIL